MRTHEKLAGRISGLSRHQQRIGVLRGLLARWIAELPTIRAVDLARARHHAEAIADLWQLIDSLEAAGKRMRDPQFLKCPACGYPLTYVRSEGPTDVHQATHVYCCRNHGVVVHPPSGIIQVEDPDHSALRH